MQLPRSVRAYETLPVPPPRCTPPAHAHRTQQRTQHTTCDRISHAARQRRSENLVECTRRLLRGSAASNFARCRWTLILRFGRHRRCCALGEDFARALTVDRLRVFADLVRAGETLLHFAVAERSHSRG